MEMFDLSDVKESIDTINGNDFRKNIAKIQNNFKNFFIIVDSVFKVNQAIMKYKSFDYGNSKNKVNLADFRNSGRCFNIDLFEWQACGAVKIVGSYRNSNDKLSIYSVIKYNLEYLLLTDIDNNYLIYYEDSCKIDESKTIKYINTDFNCYLNIFEDLKKKFLVSRSEYDLYLAKGEILSDLVL